MGIIDPQIFLFFGLITVLIVTPGANTMLVARNVIVGGQNAGFLVTLGGCIGVLVHAVLSGLGLTAILVQSARVFETVKLLGALYLVFLGLQSVRRAFRGGTSVALGFSEGSADTPKGIAITGRKSLVEGFTAIILSPETSVFYLAVLPQFIHEGDAVLQKSFILSGIHILVRVVWYSTLTIFIGRMRTFLQNSKAGKWLELSTGGVLVAWGLKMAVLRR